MKGVRPGFHQLRLSLKVSKTGEVLTAEASGDREAMKFWPEVQDEVRRWTFVPFERDGVAVTAEIEDSMDAS